jgi:stage V sporulation protein SpoVS
MSKIALTPSATGTGVFTISSPATNTDRTLTLPDEAGTVLTSASSITQNAGPAFRSRKGGANQALNNNTWTKVSFQTEIFDTDNSFDNATNFRFTPLVAGYYQINATILSQFFTAIAGSIYKNGSGDVYAVGVGTYAQLYSSVTISDIFYLNGSTDYVEIYAYQASGAGTNMLDGQCSFSAAMVRAA